LVFVEAGASVETREQRLQQMSVDVDYLKRLNDVFGELGGMLHNGEISATLNPGVSDEELDLWERSNSVALPKDIRALYKWRNGCSGESSIMPEFYLLSLRDISEIVSGTPEWRRKGLYPIFANGAGDFLYVLAGKDGGYVYVWRVYDQMELAPSFDSLLTLCQTLLAGYKRRIIRVADRTSQVLSENKVYREITRPVTISVSDRKWLALVEGIQPKGRGAMGADAWRCGGAQSREKVNISRQHQSW
jgi:hypothetical protein